LLSISLYKKININNNIMEFVKLLFFKNERNKYLKNQIIKEYNNHDNKSKDEEYIYSKLFKKLSILKQ